MTQNGKCDVCRSRKVKCDQGRPACEACVKGGRPCSYRFREQSRSNSFTRSGVSTPPDHNTALRLKSTRRAAEGRGVFQTFAAHNTIRIHTNPSTALSNETTQLAAKWIRMLTRMPPTFSQEMPARLGSNSALDAVADFLCDCHNFFITQNESCIQTTQESGLKAARSVRLAISDTSRDIPDAVLIAVRLLLIAEYVRDVSATDFKYHSRAISQILKARFSSNKTKWGALEEHLFRSNVIEEVGGAVISGTLTEMDDPVRLQAKVSARQSLSPSEIDAGRMRIIDNLYRHPRLVFMVRKLQEHPNDRSLLVSTLALAESMYDLVPTLHLPKFVDDSMTVYEAATSPLGSFIKYGTEEAFEIGVAYYFYRLLICATIQRVFSIVDPSLLPTANTYFDLTAIQMEEVQAAEHLAMGSEFAFAPTLGPPFRALRIITSNSVSYGTWHRLRQRTVDNDPLTAEHAARMEDFVYRTAVRIGIVFKLRQKEEDLVKREIFEQVSAAWVGGPAIPWFTH